VSSVADVPPTDGLRRYDRTIVDPASDRPELRQPPVAAVRAAGGVLVREATGGPEVAVVHRPKYDDWSFPKGKLTSGERDEDAAVREVEEETGFRAELLDELTPVMYLHRSGKPKIVRYWRMRVIGGAFEPNAEVDRLAWLTIADADARLTYGRDRALLAETLGARTTSTTGRRRSA